MTVKDIADQLGIQSYCFREFREAPALIEKVLESGMKNLEVWDGHCGAQSADADAYLQQIADAGITVNAIGVCHFSNDEAAGRTIMEFAKKVGCSIISADLAEGSYETVTRLSQEYGIKIAIHNHGRKHRLGSVAALAKVFDQTGPEIGLCLDTAWMIDSGEDAVAVAKRFKDRLYGIHIKDFVFDRAGKPEDVIVGTGNLALPELMEFLVSIDYQGYVALEYEGDADNPVPAIKECVKAVQACC